MMDNKIGDFEIELKLFSQMETTEKRTKKTDFDDEVYINVEHGKGIIAGVNSRSVLIAVYHFLTCVGCRFIRPGTKGEYIPEVEAKEQSVFLHEAPSFRHRCICIEGSNSYENVRDMIGYMPKLGYNAYFIQLRNVLEKHYSNHRTPFKKTADVDVNLLNDYMDSIREEIDKRDLIYQAVGHGWICESLGIDVHGWSKYQYKLADNIKQYFAMINNKRELFNATPLLTNLCYSNPQAMRFVVKEVCKYVSEHTTVDIIHFWLADCNGNYCECDECAKLRVADYLIIDAE